MSNVPYSAPGKAMSEAGGGLRHSFNEPVPFSSPSMKTVSDTVSSPHSSAPIRNVLTCFLSIPWLLPWWLCYGVYYTLGGKQDQGQGGDFSEDFRAGTEPGGQTSARSSRPVSMFRRTKITPCWQAVQRRLEPAHAKPSTSGSPTSRPGFQWPRCDGLPSSSAPQT